mmetsp:Transcript_2643/g.10228  ORF Transcript_2643/g.10228 Transcript_2643/m.10228 type:complete len:217 (-) Transcript_2643:662-1312(-)
MTGEGKPPTAPSPPPLLCHTADVLPLLRGASARDPSLSCAAPFAAPSSALPALEWYLEVVLIRSSLSGAASFAAQSAEVPALEWYLEVRCLRSSAVGLAAAVESTEPNLFRFNFAGMSGTLKRMATVDCGLGKGLAPSGSFSESAKCLLTIIDGCRSAPPFVFEAPGWKRLVPVKRLLLKSFTFLASFSTFLLHVGPPSQSLAQLELSLSSCCDWC